MKLALIGLLGLVALSNAALITMSFCSAENGVQMISDSRTGTASAITACDTTTGNGATAHLTASADYGNLQMQMLARIGPLSNLSPTTAFVMGSASYTDTITVLGIGSGFIRTSLLYSMSTIDGFGAADFMLGSYSAPTFFSSTLGVGSVMADVPIVFGSPTPIFARLAGTGIGDFAAVTMSQFRFGQGFEVLDESKNRLTQYQYTSASNEDYPLSGGTLLVVPEPLSWVTALTGFAMMALMRRRNS